MKESSFSIAVILPVYNEGDNISDTVACAAKFLGAQTFLTTYEIIVVDDGSTDATRAVLNSLLGQFSNLKVLHHPRNLGYGPALVSGIKQAVAEWILLMDADGQFKIEALLPMIPYLDNYDILAGFRSQRTDPLYRIVLGQIYSRLATVLFKVNLIDINCGFKLFRRNIIDIESIGSHGGVFYTDFFIKALKHGCRVKQFPVEHFPRKKGKQTGASLKVIFAAVIDIIRLLFARE
ncbi:MAG: glycosyltransferase family 2 protein [Candidatus Omnitrophota bacterium]|jgi:glycosyltransferase involved in cell wall biosynthesis